MMMTPIELLVLMVVITAIAGGIQIIRRRRRVGALRRLAQEWRMHFSANDRFHLAGRVAARLGVPGAASVRIGDLLYAIERENYRYVFRTEYTIGVLQGKRGVRQIGTLAELRDGALAGPGGAAPEIEFAPSSLGVIEQYRHLLEKCEAA